MRSILATLTIATLALGAFIGISYLTADSESARCEAGYVSSCHSLFVNATNPLTGKRA